MSLLKKNKKNGSDSQSDNTIKKLNLDNVESISPNEFKDITWDVLHHSEHHHHHHSGSHRHHHHHSNEEAAKENSEKLTDFSSDEIEQRTTEYTSAHRIDRGIPKHPHRHDKIAHDAKYSEEELDKLNADKIDGYGETGVDEFKKGFDDRLREPSHHHHHHSSGNYQKIESDINSDGTESFDADKFLSDFQKSSSGSSSHHHHHHSSGHGSSSHHSSSEHHHSSHSRDKDVASMSEVGTKDFFNEYQKTLKENEQLKKQIRLEKIRSEMSE